MTIKRSCNLQNYSQFTNGIGKNNYKSSRRTRIYSLKSENRRKLTIERNKNFEIIVYAPENHATGKQKRKREPQKRFPSLILKAKL